jgi:radical SAM protein with 4Fe4S-binding SPASM domain
MIELVSWLDIVFWEVFVLVPIGRGTELEGLTAEECEQLLTKLYHASTCSRFLLKVTEAPHYRRVIMQQRAASPHTVQDMADSAIPTQLGGSMKPAQAFGRKAKGINAGKGFCFVSHTGEVFPSGFLPISAGNVRTSSLAALYRDSELFKTLRDPDRLQGRCGRCEFRDICGGSRSRAYALTGDMFAEDPACLYNPQRFSR